MPKKGMRTLLYSFKSNRPSWPSPPPGDTSTSYSLASTPQRNTQSMVERSITMADLMVNKWNSDTNGYADVTSLFYENRQEAIEFIKCVFNLQKSMHLISHDDPNNNMVRAHNLMQIAMKRLQKEFYQILSTNRAQLDPESVSARSSRTSSTSSISDFEDDSGSTRDSISEIERVSLLAMDNLRCIAECMVATGYAKECFKIYTIIRKSIINEALFKLGIEKISQNQFNKLTSGSQDIKIKQWLHAANIAVKTLFAGERILCDYVFEASDRLRESCFNEVSIEASSLLFSFPELVLKSKKSTEKMLRVLDIYAALIEHWSDIDAVFSSDSCSVIRAQAMRSLPKLADAVRSLILEFESAVRKDSHKAIAAAYGGGVDPLTICVMNILSSLSNHAVVLSDILSSLPTPVRSPDSSLPGESPASICINVSRLIGIVLSKIDDRSKLYRDASTSFLFIANNLNHVVSKTRRSNLKYILGESWIRSQEDIIGNSIERFVAAAWGGVSDALPDETAVISSTEAKDMFKKFNVRFGEAYRKQSACVVEDQRLRDEIKACVEMKVVTRYRDFIKVSEGKIRVVREGSLNLVVRYTPEDVANYLSDLYFDGSGEVDDGGSTISFSSPSPSVMSADNRFRFI